MVSWLNRLTGGGANAPAERKSTGAQSLFALSGAGEVTWTNRGFSALANQGYEKNPVVYRCIRMICDAATRVPLGVSEKGTLFADHPVLTLLACPNPRQSGSEIFEQIYSYLHTAGNAYLEAVIDDGKLKGIYSLRPDRMKVVAGSDGWPMAYDYTASGRTIRLNQHADPIPKVLHLKTFHPLDDHYGLAPLNAAQTSLDTHNAAAQWNKSLLDNAARPSGALVYAAASGNLTSEQFERLKNELAIGFQGATNAGRPMVLEGGLDWKSMSLSPKDMDFIEAKNAAAREIALAFGVPPMLLGIPGDNTYTNFAEANRMFWRQTIVPLVRRTSSAMTRWLSPAFEGEFELVPQLDDIEALAEDRTALWQRIGQADFLTDAEKRAQLGYPPRDSSE